MTCLHSGNIFSNSIGSSYIGDLGLCQQVVDKKVSPNKIFGGISSKNMFRAHFTKFWFFT